MKTEAVLLAKTDPEEGFEGFLLNQVDVKCDPYLSESNSETAAGVTFDVKPELKDDPPLNQVDLTYHTNPNCSKSLSETTYIYQFQSEPDEDDEPVEDPLQVDAKPGPGLLSLSSQQPSKSQAWACDDCNQDFPDLPALQTHVLGGLCHRSPAYAISGITFTEVLDPTQQLTYYQCSFCGKIFQSRSSCYTHATVHSGARPYRCTICGGTYKNGYSLKKHARIHVPLESRYPCTIRTCTNVFQYRGDLQYHLRRFHGVGGKHKHVSYSRPVDKPKRKKPSVARPRQQQRVNKGKSDRGSFKCKTCQRPFNTAYYLQMHQVIHT